MAKYCKNPECEAYGKTQEGGKFCGLCGTPLEDTPPKQKISKDFSGDGVSVSRVSNDSHDTISNNNTTYVFNGGSINDLTLKDRKTEYRKFCTEHIKNGIITIELRRELDKFAIELDLSNDARKEIERSVRDSSSKSSYELSTFDYDNLEIIKTAITNNKVRLNDAIPKLEAMSSCDNDEVHYILNFLLVCMSPSLLINKYNEREQDIYWKTFWAYLALIKNGQKIKAEQALRELSAWDTQAQDNLYLLQSAGAVIENDFETASILHSRAKNFSHLLEPLHKTTSFIIKTKSFHKLSNSNEVNFFLEKLFGVKEESIIEEASSYRAPIPTPLQDRVEGRVNPSVIPSSNDAQRSNPKQYSFVKYIRIAATVAIIIVAIIVVAKVVSHENPKTTPQSTQVVKGSQNSSSTITPSPAVSKTNGNTNTGGPSTSKQTITDSNTSAMITEPTATTKAPSAESTKKTESSVAPQAQSDAQVSQKEDHIVTLKISADSGDKDAMLELGMRYYEGNGVVKNMSLAFQYLKPLAEEGYVKAYFPVADMYHRGQGVAKDRDAAEKWYTKAAEAGNSKAKTILFNNF